MIPTIDMEATGENIRRIRQDRGIQITELQDIFGFNHPQSIYRWQSGKSLPTVDNLVILASVLGVTIDEIIATNYRR